MMKSSFRIAISAGESSGDEHAAHLVAALKRFLPNDANFRGMGGSSLRSEGVDIVIDFEDHGAVMGFAEVLLSARRLLGNLTAMKNLLREWRPEVLVVVDYPDFNIALAKEAKKLGIKVLYYITPQLWAWRSGRARTIDACVDLAAVIFPFERRFFESHGFARSIFVGHPFCDELKRFNDKEAEEGFRNIFLLSQNLDPHHPVAALFPGSRPQEVGRHLTPMLRAASAVKDAHPSVQFVVSVVPAVSPMVSDICANGTVPVRLISGKARDVLRTADAGILKSGTSNLQAAFYGLPFAMFYRTSKMSEFIVRNFVKVREFSIVNVLRPGTVAELLQNNASPQAAAEELTRLLFDEHYRGMLRAGLLEAISQLSLFDPHPGFEHARTCAERTAVLVLELLR